MIRRQLTVAVMTDGDGSYNSFVKEIPGANGAGVTKAAAIQDALEALDMILEYQLEESNTFLYDNRKEFTITEHTVGYIKVKVNDDITN